MQKAKLVREYREHAAEEAMACAYQHKLKEPIKQPVTQIAYFNKRRVRPDADNILASLKPVFDGFTDAGIWTDDRLTVHLPVRRLADKDHPRVEIIITDGMPDDVGDVVTSIMKEEEKWQVSTKS